MSLMCEYCNKNFNSKSNLTRHQKTTKSCILIQKEKFNIGGENILTYSCKYCNKNFTSKQGLNSHLGICSSKQGNDIFQQKYKLLTEKHNKIIYEKEKIISELKQEENKIIKRLRNEILILKTNLVQENNNHEKYNILLHSCISELQGKLQEIAIMSLEQKNEVITNMVKKYVKKQPRKQFDCSNVIYILTTPSLKKDNRYVLGKAKNLTNRLSTYNKTDEHEVIFYQDCGDEDTMNTLEPMVFNKLKDFREQANRERFILPKDKTVQYFINKIKTCFDFLI